MRIFLIGMPGSGKTTIGKSLARALDYHFVDTDELIIQKESKSIDLIFKDHGESYFRETERTVLKELTSSEDIVIATGGGTPCFFDNIELMNKTGITIFLDVPVESLFQRINAGKNKNRPMVQGKNEQELKAFIQEKYGHRSQFYQQARIKLKGDAIDYKDVIAAVSFIKK